MELKKAHANTLPFLTATPQSVLDMTPELKSFISRYVHLDTTALTDISGRFRKKKLKKNDFLLREGEVCSDIIFVQEGCLRLFYISDDIETSVWFSFRGSSAIEISSFISGRPLIRCCGGWNGPASQAGPVEAWARAGPAGTSNVQ